MGREHIFFFRGGIAWIGAIVVESIDDQSAFDAHRGFFFLFLLCVLAFRVEQQPAAEPANGLLARLVQRGVGPHRLHASRCFGFGLFDQQREGVVQIEFGASGRQRAHQARRKDCRATGATAAGFLGKTVFALFRHRCHVPNSRSCHRRSGCFAAVACAARPACWPCLIESRPGALLASKQCHPSRLRPFRDRALTLRDAMVSWSCSGSLAHASDHDGLGGCGAWSAGGGIACGSGVP